MASPNRVIDLGLEQLAVKLRAEGLTQAKILAGLNEELGRRRQVNPTADQRDLGLKSLVRYFATLDAATLPAAHQPQAVAENAALQIRFGQQFADLNETIGVWLEEAKGARKLVAVAGVGVEDVGPDWDARTKVAKALQQNLDSYGDLLERIYNAEQIKMFREEVLRAIREESPECARRIQARMQERQSIRVAALTGA